MQQFHRYADGVLLLLIAALAWWLVGLDGRITRNTDRIQVAQTEAMGTKERGEALLRRLEQIDMRLVTIDNRLYVLSSGGRRGISEIP